MELAQLNNREDYLNGLQMEYERHLFCVSQHEKCDTNIAELLKIHIASMADVLDELPSDKKHNRLNKNSIKTIDFNIVAFQYLEGVDLIEIPGVSYVTLLSIMSEVGR